MKRFFVCIFIVLCFSCSKEKSREEVIKEVVKSNATKQLNHSVTFIDSTFSIKEIAEKNNWHIHFKADLHPGFKPEVIKEYRVILKDLRGDSLSRSNYEFVIMQQVIARMEVGPAKSQKQE